jgi:hypothetical protein
VRIRKLFPSIKSFFIYLCGYKGWGVAKRITKSMVDILPQITVLFDIIVNMIIV